MAIVIRTIKGCIYRRIHDGRLAIIVSADPLRNISRVGHIAVDPAGGGPIPPGESRHDRAQQPAARGSDLSRTEIRLELIPCVAHRGVTVADVQRPSRANHRFHRAVARADHEIEGVEVEELDGGGEEREELTIVPRRRWESLDERGPNPAVLDRGGHLPAGVDEAVERGVRVEVGNGLQDLFSASHAGEPIVNQRDSGLALAGGRASGRVTRHWFTFGFTLEFTSGLTSPVLRRRSHGRAGSSAPRRNDARGRARAPEDRL